MMKTDSKPLMTSSKTKFLAQILEEENYRLFDPLTCHFSIKESSQNYHDVQEVFYDYLEGKGNPFPIKLSFPLIHDNFVLILDEELSFNRYRKTTLRSAFYEKFSGLNLNQYQRYCRTYEKNCLKLGLQNGIWTNELAEKYFNNPSEPGDFFANGSPGWKYQAFHQYLHDLYAHENNWKFYRISIYDNVLTEGKLQPIGKMMETRNEKYKKIIFNFLKMKLKL